MDNTKVVTAKEAKPKGLGFATIQKKINTKKKRKEKRTTGEKCVGGNEKEKQK